MSDSVRMMDLAGLTRGLDEFRRLDPEQRALAERLAARAAARHLEEVREDVPDAGAAAQARLDDRQRQGQGGRHPQDHRPKDPEPSRDAAPEREEGLLLDIKV
ncbi:MAG: hypothetical protein HZB55_22730 [Deltaproteobacteria bacterium]|nr:hypothetical protein [Deltaproteobacteria bacterium]